MCRWVYQEYFKIIPPTINFNFQGRLEVLSEKPLIIFDSAHNEVAIKELALWLFSHKSHLKWVLYGNTLQNKNFKKMIDILLFHANKKIAKIYFVDFLDNNNKFHQFEDLNHDTQIKLTPIKIQQEFHRLLTNTQHAHLIYGSMYLYEKLTMQFK